MDLLSLSASSCPGIDEGWEGCGMGVTVSGRKTQHYANGTPAINAKFPDIGALVKYGHSKGLKMGWSAPPTPPPP